MFVFVAPVSSQTVGEDTFGTHDIDSTGLSDSRDTVQQFNTTEYDGTAGNITLSLRQHGRQGERVVGSPMMFDAVIESPSSGVASYDFNFKSNETATTANVSFTDWTFNKSGLTIVNISSDGSSVMIGSAQLDNKYNPAEEVVVGQMTVVAEEAGDVVIEPTAASVSNNNVTQYDTSVEPTSMTVIENLEPLPGAQGPPRDITGDGLLEDVNGDGKVNLFDALTLFDNQEYLNGQDLVPFFDFASSPDTPDRIDLFDALALFDQQDERSPN